MGCMILVVSGRLVYVTCCVYSDRFGGRGVNEGEHFEIFAPHANKHDRPWNWL